MWLRCALLSALVALTLSCSASSVALRPQPECHLSAIPQWVGDVFDGPFEDPSEFCDQTFTVDERVFQKCSNWKALPIEIPEGWKALGDPYLSVRRFSAIDHEGNNVCALGVETRRGFYVGVRSGICPTNEDRARVSFTIDRLALVRQLAPQEPLLRIHVAARERVAGQSVLQKESVIYCGTGASGRLSCLKAFPFRVRTKSEGAAQKVSSLHLSLGTDGRLLLSGDDQELAPEQKPFKGHPCLHFP